MTIMLYKMILKQVQIAEILFKATSFSLKNTF